MSDNIRFNFLKEHSDCSMENGLKVDQMCVDILLMDRVKIEQLKIQKNIIFLICVTG